MKRTHRVNVALVAGTAVVAMVLAACSSSGTPSSQLRLERQRLLSPAPR